MKYYHINSKDNAKIKHVVKLINSSKYRLQQSSSVVYGLHLIEESIKYNLLQQLFVTQSQLVHLQNLQLHLKKIPLYIVADQIMNKIGVADAMPTVVGIIDMQNGSIEPAIYDEDCIILENIQDSGNLGTIMRACAASGVRNIILSNDCVSPFNTKVIRASQGIQFGLNIVCDVDLCAFIDKYKHQILATVVKSSTVIYDCQLTYPCAWVFGNEGCGISANLSSKIENKVTVPMLGNCESLNVASAATVCLFEMLRQRLFQR